MKQNATCPLEQVPCCHEVPEHHDPVDAAGAPFQPAHLLDGRFLVTEVLSRSGMGTIFKAEDKQDGNRIVALKVPHLEYASDPNFFSRAGNARSFDRRNPDSLGAVASPACGCALDSLSSPPESSGMANGHYERNTCC